jgi:hypothetical protein
VTCSSLFEGVQPKMRVRDDMTIAILELGKSLDRGVRAFELAAITREFTIALSTDL